MSSGHSKRRTTPFLLSALALTAAAAGCGAKQAKAPETALAVNQAPQATPEQVAQSPQRSNCEPVSAQFGYDDSELSPSAREALASYQRCVQRLGVDRVHVRGMTDPRGTEEYNLALGARRADAAARYLTALGLTGADVSSVGEELAQGADETSWAKDRRADVTLP